MLEPSSTQPTPAPETDALPAPPTEAGEAPPASRSALAIVFLVVVIDLLGFGIVLPLLPRLGDEYIEALFPGGKEGAAGGAVLGGLLAVFSLMQFLFAPAWGRFSDRIGRRPVLLVGLAGSVVFYALLGFALTFSKQDAVLALALLFAARAGAGVAGATIATAQAAIADCTPPERRKQGMALIGAAFGIGFTLGPVVGGVGLTIFPDKGWLVGALASVLSLGALLFGLARLPETRREGGPRAARRLIDFGAVRWALAAPAVAPVLWTFFLASLGFAGFEATLSLLVRDSLGLNEADTFWLFAYVGLVLVLTQGLVYRRWVAPVLTEPTLMALGLGLMGLGVLTLGGVSWLASRPDRPGFGVLLGLTLPVLAVAVVGFAFLTPSAQALISRRSPDDRQGEVLGVNQSASALARILGPLCGLALYKATTTHLLPYAFGAGLLLLMLPLIPRIRRG
jgi:MFS transporter, DHA1 family, tetracycline resistance protein